MISDDLNELRPLDTTTVDLFCTLVIIVATVGFSQNLVLKNYVIFS